MLNPLQPRTISHCPFVPTVPTVPSGLSRLFTLSLWALPSFVSPKAKLWTGSGGAGEKANHRSCGDKCGSREGTGVSGLTGGGLG